MTTSINPQTVPFWKKFVVIAFFFACAVHTRAQITWEYLNNMTWQNDELEATVNHHNAFAAASSYLAAGEDGWLEFEMTDNPNYQSLGFSVHNNIEAEDANYDLIAGIYRINGKTQVYENGTMVGDYSSVTIANGDFFRITRTGSTLIYSVNGTAFHTSTNVNTARDWYPKVSLNSIGTTSGKITASFDGELQVKPVVDNGEADGTMDVTLTPMNAVGTVSYSWRYKSDYDEAWQTLAATTASLSDMTSGIYEVTAQDDQSTEVRQLHLSKVSMQWAHLTDMTEAGNVLEAQVNHAKAHAGAKNYLAAGEDGWIEFEMVDGPRYQSMGFSVSNSAALASNVYDMIGGVYRHPNKTEIYENGVRKAIYDGLLILNGDRLRVERVGTTLTYSINGTVFHTTTDVNTLRDWYPDVSLNAIGDKSGRVSASFESDLQLHADVDDGAADGSMDVTITPMNAVGSVSYSWRYKSDVNETWQVLAATTASLSDIASGIYEVTVQDGQSTEVREFRLYKASQLQWAYLADITEENGVLEAQVNHAKAHAGTKNYLAAGENGWIEFEMIDNPRYQSLGFSVTNTAEQALNVYDMIGGVYRHPTKTEIYESGVRVARYEGLVIQKGDRLRITRTGTTLTYSINETVFHTSNDLNILRDWYTDISLNAIGDKSGRVTTSFESELQLYADVDDGASDGTMDVTLMPMNAEGSVSYSWRYKADVNDAWQALSATTASLSDIATGIYEATAQDAQSTEVREFCLVKATQLQWAYLTDITEDNGVLEALVNHAKAHAGTKNYLAAGEDGWVEFEMTDNPRYQALGFSLTNTAELANNVYDMVGGVYRHPDKTDIYESGVRVGRYNDLIIQNGDRLRITREGTTLTYSVNGIVFHTSTDISTLRDWYTDISLNAIGDKSGRILTSFESEFQLHADVDDGASDGTMDVALTPMNASGSVSYSWRYKADVDEAWQALPAATASLSGIASGIYEVTAQDTQNTEVRVLRLNKASQLQWAYLTDITEDNGVLEALVNHAKAHAGAKNYLAAGEDGWLELEMIDNPRYQAFGFSITNAAAFANNVYDMIGGIYRHPDKTDIYENGVRVGRYDDLIIQNGDRVRIERTGTTLTYSVNETVFHTSTDVNTAKDWYPDVSLNGIGDKSGRITTSFESELQVHADVDDGLSDGTLDITLTPLNANGTVTYTWRFKEKVSDAWQDLSETTAALTDIASGIYEVTAQDDTQQEVRAFRLYKASGLQWTNVSNMDWDGRELTATASNFNANASSLNFLPAQEDGWLEFQITDGTSYQLLGFTSEDEGTAASRTSDMLFGVYRSNNYTRVYLNGVEVPSSIPEVVNGDLLRLEREGETVKILVNENEVYTRNGVDNTKDWKVNVTLYSTGDKTGNIYCSFDRLFQVIADPVLNDPFASPTVEGGLDVAVLNPIEPATYSWSSGETTPSLGTVEGGVYTLTITHGDQSTTEHEFVVDNKVEWAKLQNLIELPDGRVERNAPLDHYDGLAWTKNYLKAGENGRIRYVIPQGAYNQRFGLTKFWEGNDWRTVDYAFSFKGSGGYVDCMRGGKRLLLVASSAVHAGDVYEIERLDGNINFYKNGVQVYTTPDVGPAVKLRGVVSLVGEGEESGIVTTTFGSGLRADIQVNSSQGGDGNGGIQAAAYGGDGTYTYSWNTGATTSSLSGVSAGEYTLTVTDGTGATYEETVKLHNQVVWSYLDGMEVDADGRVVKNIANSHTTSFAGSSNNLAPGQDGKLMYYKSSTQDVDLGLSTNPMPTEKEAFDYRFNFNSHGYSRIWESGIKKMDLIHHNQAGWYEIERVGDQMIYRENGNEVRTITVDPNERLYVVTHGYYEGVHMGDFYTTFGAALFAQVNITNNDPYTSPTVEGKIDLTVLNGTEPVSFLWSNGATSEDLDAVVGGEYTVTVTDGAGQHFEETFVVGNKVKWVKTPHATVLSDGRLERTSPSSHYNGLNIGANTLGMEEDGRIRYTIPEGIQTQSFGFVSHTFSEDPRTLDYAFHFVPSGGYVHIRVGGKTVINLGSGYFVRGDVFEIERAGMQMNFYKNGNLEHTIALTNPKRELKPGLNLFGLGEISEILDVSYGSDFDVDLEVTPYSENVGGSIDATPVEGDGNYTFSWSTGSDQASVTGLLPGTYTVTVSDGTGNSVNKSVDVLAQPNWGYLDGLEGTANGSLIKTIANSHSTGFAASSWSLAPGEDGKLTCYKNTIQDIFIGLSNNAEPAATADFDYCFWLNSHGYAYIYESGANRKSLPSHNQASYYEIERIGDQLIYRENGNVARTITVDPNEELYVVTQAYYEGIELGDIRVSWGNEVEPTFDYTVQHIEGNTNGSITVTTNLSPENVQYNWSTGASTAAITDLLPGTYHVEITFAEGDVINKTFEILRKSAVETGELVNATAVDGQITLSGADGWDTKGGKIDVILDPEDTYYIEYEVTQLDKQVILGFTHQLQGLDQGQVYAGFMQDNVTWTTYGTAVEAQILAENLLVGDRLGMLKTQNEIRYFRNGIQVGQNALPTPSAPTTIEFQGNQDGTIISGMQTSLGSICSISFGEGELEAVRSMCYGETNNLNLQGAAAYEWEPFIGLTANNENQSNITVTPGYATQYQVIGYDEVDGVRYQCGSATVDVILDENCANTCPIAVQEQDASGLVEVCQGETLTLNASGADAYSWFPEAGLSCADCATPTLTPGQSPAYWLKGYTTGTDGTPVLCGVQKINVRTKTNCGTTVSLTGATIGNYGAHIHVGQGARLITTGSLLHENGVNEGNLATASVLNNGTLGFAENWVNNTTTDVHLPASTGEVDFAGTEQIVAGVHASVFPKMVLSGNGRVVLHTDASTGAIELNDGELAIEDYQLTNQSGQVQYGEGFISTDQPNGQYAVQFSAENTSAEYPLGSAKEGLVKGFVTLSTPDAQALLGMHMTPVAPEETAGEVYVLTGKEELNTLPKHGGIQHVQGAYFQRIQALNGAPTSELTIENCTTDETAYNAFVAWDEFNGHWKEVEHTASTTTSPQEGGQCVQVTTNIQAVDKAAIVLAETGFLIELDDFDQGHTGGEILYTLKQKDATDPEAEFTVLKSSTGNMVIDKEGAVGKAYEIEIQPGLNSSQGVVAFDIEADGVDEVLLQDDAGNVLGTIDPVLHDDDMEEGRVTLNSSPYKYVQKANKLQVKLNDQGSYVFHLGTDQLEVVGNTLDIQATELVVRDAQEQTVFSQTTTVPLNAPLWDGTQNGSNVAPGVYSFELQAVVGGKQRIYQGQFIIQ